MALQGMLGYAAVSGSCTTAIPPCWVMLSRPAVPSSRLPESTTPMTRERALRAALRSTHTVLTIEDGELLSLTDPPPELRAEAERCENLGAWPVLAGEPG